MSVSREFFLLWCLPQMALYTSGLQNQNYPEAGLKWTPCRPLLFSDRRPYRTPYTRTLFSMAIFSTGVWMMGIFFFRQTLKLLLSYHGWMFELHGQTSHLTRVWAVSGGRWRDPGIWFETAGPHFGF